MKTYLDTKAIQSFKNFIFDCDGVIWHGMKLLPGSKNLLSKLKESNKQIILLSNNSSISAEEYVTKSKRLGLDIHKDQIACASGIFANYLKSQNFKGKVYIIGEEGIQKELSKVNIISFGVGNENRYFADLIQYPQSYDDEVKAVVVGFDTKFNLSKLTLAAGYIANKKCTFYATNADSNFPTSTYIVPGTGALVKAVAEASGVEPIITGKPTNIAFQTLKDKYGIDPLESIMIGDNVNTDIIFGNVHGMTTLLVFSGVAKPEDLDRMDPSSSTYPNYYCSSLADLENLF